jgi:hypothetical protein
MRRRCLQCTDVRIGARLLRWFTRSTVAPRTTESFPFSGRLAACAPPLKSRSFSTQNNDPKGIRQPDMRVSAGTEHRETHRRNEADLVAEGKRSRCGRRSSQPAGSTTDPSPTPSLPGRAPPACRRPSRPCSAFAPKAGPAILLSLWLVEAQRARLFLAERFREAGAVAVPVSLCPSPKPFGPEGRGRGPGRVSSRR